MTVFLFKEINLMLLASTPEIGLGITACVNILLHRLGYGKVFPQFTCIGAVFYLCKIADDGIADTKVPKIDFKTGIQFVAMIPRKGSKAEDDV